MNGVDGVSLFYFVYFFFFLNFYIVIMYYDDFFVVVPPSPPQYPLFQPINLVDERISVANAT